MRFGWYLETLYFGCACVMLLAGLSVEAQAQPQRNDTEAVRVLTVGGDQHHDFAQWFGEADATTLEAVGAAVRYTEVPDQVLSALDTLDVLYLSNNQPLPGELLREGIFGFVDRGNGLMIYHAAAWYSWEDWPVFNRTLVGGGARSHLAYGAFEVTVQEPEHPIMQEVPATFTLEDELYRFERDPEGPPIHVLATGEDPETGDEYPVVWTVAHDDGRIVVNTLGHDGAAHEHPAFQKMLQNSMRWAARRDE